MKNIRKNSSGFILIIVLTVLVSVNLILSRNAAGQGGGGGGGDDSVPVYETNDDLLSDIEDINDNTADILEQMEMEWDFFRDNEQTKWDTFKERQDEVLEEMQSKFDKSGGKVYITDHVDYLSAPGLKTLRNFSSDLDKGFLCESFNDQIKQMYQPEGTVKFSEKGAGGAACTISDTVGDINGFYDDFSKGSWPAFNQLFEPQNNIFGAYLLADQELALRQAAAYDAARTEDMANQGFKSNRADCAEEDANGICIKSAIGDFPGIVYANQTSKLAYAEFDYIMNAGDLEPYSEDTGNTFLDRMFDEITKMFGEMKTSKSSNKPKPPADDPCIFWKDINPELYQSCTLLYQSGQDIIKFWKQNGYELIDKAVGHKNEARNYYTSAQSPVNQLISTLNNLLACQGGTDADTQSRIASAIELQTFIASEIQRLNQEISDLAVAKVKLNALTDGSAVLSYVNELEDKYKIKKAKEEAANARTIRDSITPLINQAKADLTTCLATPVPTPTPYEYYGY